MTDRYADKLWPITVPKENPAALKVGDKFTMEVPCDPATGAIAWNDHMDTVLMVRKFVVKASA